MKQQPFDFGLGKVTWSSWDFDESRPISEQMCSHERDLIQVQYTKSRLTLDISWMQRRDASRGAFLVVLIKDHEWEKPLVKKHLRSLKALHSAIPELVARVNKIEKQSSKRSR